MPMRTREEQRAYQLQWIKKRKQDWIDANGPCAYCGSEVELEVDHVDYRLKLFPVSRLWALSEGNPKRVSELAKCQVLCKTCHADKSGYDIHHMKTRRINHGTENAYNKRGCRCDICHAWRSNHYKETGT